MCCLLLDYLSLKNLINLLGLGYKLLGNSQYSVIRFLIDLESLKFGSNARFYALLLWERKMRH